MTGNYQNIETSPIFETTSQNYQKYEISPTLATENYQNIETSANIETTTTTENYQNIETTPILETTNVSEYTESYHTSNIPTIETQLIENTNNADQTIEPFIETKETTISTHSNEAQISNPIIEDLSSIFTTMNTPIIDLSSENKTTQNFETKTEEEYSFKNDNIVTTPLQTFEETNIQKNQNISNTYNVDLTSELVSSDTTNTLKDYQDIDNNLNIADNSSANTGFDLDNIQTTDNIDYETLLDNYQASSSTRTELKELSKPEPLKQIFEKKKEVIQKPIMTSPVEYTTYTQTTPIETNIRSKPGYNADKRLPNAINYFNLHTTNSCNIY